MSRLLKKLISVTCHRYVGCEHIKNCIYTLQRLQIKKYLGTCYIFSVIKAHLHLDKYKINLCGKPLNLTASFTVHKNVNKKKFCKIFFSLFLQLAASSQGMSNINRNKAPIQVFSCPGKHQNKIKILIFTTHKGFYSPH